MSLTQSLACKGKRSCNEESDCHNYRGIHQRDTPEGNTRGTHQRVRRMRVEPSGLRGEEGKQGEAED